MKLVQDEDKTEVDSANLYTLYTVLGPIIQNRRTANFCSFLFL
jgi:hypothetical protein